MLHKALFVSLFLSLLSGCSFIDTRGQDDSAMRTKRPLYSTVSVQAFAIRAGMQEECGATEADMDYMRKYDLLAVDDLPPLDPERFIPIIKSQTPK